MQGQGVVIKIILMITSFQDLIIAFQKILTSLFPIVGLLALLYFFWGIALFIFQSGDEKKVEEGKSKMKWGIVSLFVMVSVWGLVSILQKDIVGNTDTGGVIPVRINR